ncbi:MAG: aldo/keto reductase [Ignavibacteria bacterium]|nr:aldo/keto reductase [Ignavibacteria bacterium]
MELIQFGNTKLKVSKIGLGLAALGRPGYINLGHRVDLKSNYDVAAMKLKTLQLLDLAYAKDIRYFDAARSYGKAELFLSEWIKSKDNEKHFTVGSKWGYTYTADWKIDAEKHEIKEHSIEVLNRQWSESKDLLGERLNIYHIHSATIESGVLENIDVLKKLWELRTLGMVIGLTLSGDNQTETLQKALTVKSGDDFLFQSVQVTWNILERSTTDVLMSASQSGIGIIIKEALANGRLTSRNDEASFFNKKEQLQVIAKKYNAGIDAISIAYILRQPWVSTVLSGATTQEQLESNLKALKVELNESELNIINSMVEPPKKYWTTRSELVWN